MKVEHLSASRIKTYEQCQLKYHAIYDLKVPEGEPHPLTIMGKAIHWVFEDGVLKMIGGQVVNLLETVEPACEKFKVDADLWPLALELVGNGIRWGALRRVGSTMECEVGFDVELAEDVKAVGYIDRVDSMAGGLDVLDYKSQKREFDDAKLPEDWQARIYNIAVRDKYAVTGNVRVSFWVLRHRVQRVLKTAEDARRDRKVLIDLAAEIRACDDPVASPSALCPWCPYLPRCAEAKKSKKQRFKERYG